MPLAHSSASALMAAPHSTAQRSLGPLRGELRRIDWAEATNGCSRLHPTVLNGNGGRQQPQFGVGGLDLSPTGRLRSRRTEPQPSWPPFGSDRQRPDGRPACESTKVLRSCPGCPFKLFMTHSNRSGPTAEAGRSSKEQSCVRWGSRFQLLPYSPCPRCTVKLHSRPDIGSRSGAPSTGFSSSPAIAGTVSYR